MPGTRYLWPSPTLGCSGRSTLHFRDERSESEKLLWASLTGCMYKKTPQNLRCLVGLQGLEPWTSSKPLDLGLWRLKHRAVARKSLRSRRVSARLSRKAHNRYVSTKKVPHYGSTWWGFRDSNPGPTGYEPGALTDWAKAPYNW